MRLSFPKNTLLIVLPLTLLVHFSCGSGAKEKSNAEETGIVIHDKVELPDKGVLKNDDIILGAQQLSKYIPLLHDKNVGVVANPTSILSYLKPAATGVEEINDAHLIDVLIDQKVRVKKVFAPEHGFRGSADAGETVKDGVDTKTGLPIISLYGKNKKPSPEQLEDIDIMVFDIQDVGVRFYTYIATMHLVMEASAEAGIPVVILDRPNPNGHYVDGPTMEKEHTSFLGMHTVPLVHGMTIGEYAGMINGEGWLANGIQCELFVVELENYTHNAPYSLPIRPSPNLPNDTAINLYPSLGLLEGTNLNAGRGTEMQFQIFGSPYLPVETYPFTYKPQPNFGSKYPKHDGKVCQGLDLRETARMDRVDLSWIIEAYKSHSNKEEFFNTQNFTAHAGTTKLQPMIERGYTMREIRKTWLADLEAYKKVREKYLLYP